VCENGRRSVQWFYNLNVGLIVVFNRLMVT